MSYRINDNCIGCTLCAKRCPVKAIKGVLKEKHSIDPDLCVECGLCGMLCKKSAVVMPDGSAAEYIPEASWLVPVIDSAQCTGCSLCIENCPMYCLELTAPKFRGDIRTFAVMKSDARCIGCGICQKHCPVEAIKMQSK